MSAVRELANGDLPGPEDFETLVPPVLRTWVRRVQGANLWLLFFFDTETVTIYTVTSNPPIPLND